MHNFHPATHVAQADLQFITDPRTILNSWSAYVHLPNAGIINSDYQVQVMWRLDQTHIEG